MRELEEKFFQSIDFEPIRLSNCSFKNLYHFGVEYGIDYCPHIEAQQSCNTCSYGAENGLYPKLSDSVYLKLATYVPNGKLTFDAGNIVDYKKSLLIKLMDLVSTDIDLHQKIKEYIEYVYSSLSHTDFWV